MDFHFRRDFGDTKEGPPLHNRTTWHSDDTYKIKLRTEIEKDYFDQHLWLRIPVTLYTGYNIVNNYGLSLDPLPSRTGRETHYLLLLGDPQRPRLPHSPRRGSEDPWTCPPLDSGRRRPTKDNSVSKKTFLTPLLWSFTRHFPVDWQNTPVPTEPR